jgi:hypothetical protein
MISLTLQEASPFISEVFQHQLPVELLPMVLYWWQCLRVRSVPYLWPPGLEAAVIAFDRVMLIKPVHQTKMAIPL